MTFPYTMIVRGMPESSKVECIVMAIDKEKRRISLSMKHLQDDPWDTLAEKVPGG